MINISHVEHLVRRSCPAFGPNKRREVVRLLAEIAHRERVPPGAVLSDILQKSPDFSRLRDRLLERRFPSLTPQERRRIHQFPQWKSEPQDRVVIRDRWVLDPQTLVIEESVQDSDLARQLRARFPQTRVQTVARYRDCLPPRRDAVQEYNRRLDTFYLIREKFDFIKPCPCSPKSVFCGYWVVNLGSGCGFECVYCYLQMYINSPGIVFPANLADFFDAFERHGKPMRVGSGELTDSLIFDSLTEFSPPIVEFFRKRRGSVFEFKTKSDCVDLLLSVPGTPQVVVSWSVNPPKVIESFEFYTATLDQRLEAMRRCADAGYRVGFHFDPVFIYDGWEKDYEALVEQVFRGLRQEQVAWVSLGTLRMTGALKAVIERRFPDSALLDAEIFPGFDGKYRYAETQRQDVYQKMKTWIRRWMPDVYLYLCMENKAMCSAASLAPIRPFRRSP